MKLRILCSTALLAVVAGLVACDSSSNPSSANENQGNGSKNENQNAISGTEPATCDVSTTSNSVTTVQSIPGYASYTSTVTNNGSRYVSIKSEYWYANDSDAASECERMKTEASHWLDGSMTVSCSGHKIFVDEIDEGSLRDHEADFRENCEVFMEAYGGRSTSSGTTPVNNGNEFSCNVTKNANSVAVDVKYKDFENISTVTLNSNGESPYLTEKQIFPTVAYAQKACQDVKDDGYYKDIECYGNTIVVGGSAEFGGLEDYELLYRKICTESEKQYKDGTLAEEYDKTFGR